MRRLPFLLLATAAACLTFAPEGLAQRGGRSGSGSGSRTPSISSGGSSRSGGGSSRSSGSSAGRSSGSSFQGSSSSRSGGYRAPTPTVGRAPSLPPTTGRSSSRPVITLPRNPSPSAPAPVYDGRPSSSIPTIFPGRSGGTSERSGSSGFSGGAASSDPYNGRAGNGRADNGGAGAPPSRVLPGSGASGADDSTRSGRNGGDLRGSAGSRAGEASGADAELGRVFADVSGAARSPRVPFPRSYGSTLYGRRAGDDRLEAIAGRAGSRVSGDYGSRFGALGSAATGGAALSAPSTRYDGTGYTAADRARNARDGASRVVEPGSRGQYSRGPLDRLAFPHRTVEDIAHGADRIRLPAEVRGGTSGADRSGARESRPSRPLRPVDEATREGMRELAARDPETARRIGNAGRALARAQGAALTTGLTPFVGVGPARGLGGSLYTVPPPRTGTGTPKGGSSGYPYCGPQWGKSYFHFQVGLYFGSGCSWACAPYFWCWYYPYYYYRYWYPGYYPYYWAYYPSYPAYPAAYYGGAVYNYYYGDSYGGGTVYDEPVGEAVGGRRVDAGEGESDAPAVSPLNSAAQRYLTLGDRAFREGRFNDAVTFYAKAIEFEPDRGVLHLILADALFATGDYHYAAYSIRRALELDPTLVDSVVDKHGFYADPAEFDRQLAVLETYTRDHPHDVDAQLVLATNFLFGNRPAATVDLFDGPFSASLRADPVAGLVLEAARAVQYGELNALQPAEGADE